LGVEAENEISNKFDDYLKLIEEWIRKPIEQIYESLKVATRIK